MFADLIPEESCKALISTGPLVFSFSIMELTEGKLTHSLLRLSRVWSRDEWQARIW